MQDALLDQTFARFPQFNGQRVEVQPLEKGGSDRSFFRVAVGDGTSLILARYGRQREENVHYVEIARFLGKVGVRVPEIYFHDESQGLIWMEDLGERDLWSYRNEPWPVRRALYQSALDELLKLHMEAHLNHDGESPKLQAEFNAELYRWEQNYFFENCLGRYFGLDAAALSADCDRALLDSVAEFLAARHRVFVHRDFQSQNIVIKNNRACFIDFQGMRPDLASLLWDPYVTLTPQERDELLGYYTRSFSSIGLELASDFQRVFDLCAMQRLMQALGAYGFLGIVKQRDDFLAHIPAALANLRQVLARIPELVGFPVSPRKTRAQNALRKRASPQRTQGAQRIPLPSVLPSFRPSVLPSFRPSVICGICGICGLKNRRRGSRRRGKPDRYGPRWRS